MDRTYLFVERNSFDTDASASDVDQPLLPPSKRQRGTPSTSSNIVDESEATPIQLPRKIVPTHGDSEEL